MVAYPDDSGARISVPVENRFGARGVTARNIIFSAERD
jgi:hypothetical protein